VGLLPDWREEVDAVPTFIRINEQYVNLDTIAVVTVDVDARKLYVYFAAGANHSLPFDGPDAERLLEALHHCRFTHAGDPPTQGGLLIACRNALNLWDKRESIFPDQEEVDQIRKAVNRIEGKQ
jgi:hypothetical protein